MAKCDCIISRIHFTKNKKPVDIHINQNDILNFVEAQTRKVFVADDTVIKVSAVDQYIYCHWCGKLIDWQRVHDLIAKYSAMIPEKDGHHRCESCKDLFEERDLQRIDRFNTYYRCHPCQYPNGIDKEAKKKIEKLSIHKTFLNLCKAIEEVTGSQRNTVEIIDSFAPDFVEKFRRL
jgi:hypothetical protein